MSKHAVGCCRCKADFVEDGLPPRLAWELAKCQARPPYPPELQQQPDPRYGEETRRRVEALRARQAAQDGQVWHCRVARWMRAAAVLGVLGACAVFWVWVVWVARSLC